jgi:hypothetical protein
VQIKAEDILHIINNKQFPSLMGNVTLYVQGRKTDEDKLERLLRIDLKQDLVVLKGRNYSEAI